MTWSRLRRTARLPLTASLPSRVGGGGGDGGRSADRANRAVSRAGARVSWLLAPLASSVPVLRSRPGLRAGRGSPDRRGAARAVSGVGA